MNIRFLFALLLVAVVGLTACGKSEQPAEQAAAPQTGSAEAQKPAAEKAMEAAKPAAEQAMEAAKPMAEQATDAAKKE